MNQPLSTELYWLVATATMTALMWVPYIINRLAEDGVWPALSNPQPDLQPKARWAERLMRAHDNAVENLVVFAPLVLAVLFTGNTSAVTAAACIIYFWARLTHVLLYTFAVPFLRTIAFFIGFACQMTLALTLLKLA
jgi:uncharacterized MAPEG superfamily protein